jgi:hypothetical protein
MYTINDDHKHIESNYITTIQPFKKVFICLLCGKILRVKPYKSTERKSIPMELDLTGISEEGLKRLTVGT